MKNPFKNLRFVFAALVMGAAVVGITSCTPPSSGTENVSIYNKWKSSYSDIFDISNNSFSCVSYAGDSLVIVKESDSSGMIYIKYTKIYDWNKGQIEKPADTTGWINTYGYWYPTNNDLVGKWYAIHYKNLTATTISISGAFGTVGGTESLDEAKTTFTVSNGYFSTYSECTKL